MSPVSQLCPPQPFVRNQASLHILTDHDRITTITTIELNAFASIVMDSEYAANQLRSVQPDEVETRLIHLIYCGSLPDIAVQQQTAEESKPEESSSQQPEATPASTLPIPSLPSPPPANQTTVTASPSKLQRLKRVFQTSQTPRHPTNDILVRFRNPSVQLFPLDVILHLNCPLHVDYNGEFIEGCPYTSGKKFTVKLLEDRPPRSERLNIIVGSPDAPTGMYTFKTSGPMVSMWNRTLSNRWRPFWRWACAPQSHITDVEPGAVCIALLYAHKQTERLPAAVSLRTLVQLAKLSAKFDINNLLRTHIADWLAPHRLRIAEPRCEAYLDVAYQFGIEEDYLGLANHLAMNCAIDDDGHLLAPGTRDRIKLNGPPLVDHEDSKGPSTTFQPSANRSRTTVIASARLILLERLRDEIAQFWDKYWQHNLVHCNAMWCDREEQHFCILKGWTVLEQLLATHNLIPTAPDEPLQSIRMSVNQFIQLLSDAGRLGTYPVSIPNGFHYIEAEHVGTDEYVGWAFDEELDQGQEQKHFQLEDCHRDACYIGKYLKMHVVDPIMQEARHQHYWIFEQVPPVLERLRTHARKS